MAWVNHHHHHHHRILGAARPFQRAVLARADPPGISFWLFMAAVQSAAPLPSCDAAGEMAGSTS